jgi:hypothetical protein
LNGRIQPLDPEVNKIALRVEQIRDEVRDDREIFFCSLSKAFFRIGASQVHLGRRKTSVHGQMRHKFAPEPLLACAEQAR